MFHLVRLQRYLYNSCQFTRISVFTKMETRGSKLTLEFLLGELSLPLSNLQVFNCLSFGPLRLTKLGTESGFYILSVFLHVGKFLLELGKFCLVALLCLFHSSIQPTLKANAERRIRVSKVKIKGRVKYKSSHMATTSTYLEFFTKVSGTRHQASPYGIHCLQLILWVKGLLDVLIRFFLSVLLSQTGPQSLHAIC